jgi:leucyl aminopeptidase
MQTSIVPTPQKRKRADMLVLPFWEGKKGGEVAFTQRGLASFVSQPLETGDFKGKEGETQALYLSRQPEKRVLLVGLGKEKDVSLETLRRSYATVTKVCRRKKIRSLNLLLPDSSIEKKALVSAVSEGLMLANYAFNLYKKPAKESEQETFLETVNFIGADKEAHEQIKKTLQLSEAVFFTRDLVNGNADQVNAQLLSKKAKEISKDYPKVKTTVLGNKELEKEKMGLLLAVNRGSDQDAALVIMEYRGDPGSKDLTAILGKGISFDTGGLNLKGTGNIETMKGDMAGSAAILGTIRAAASLGIKRNILGVIACAENAIGPKSYKPGDVYISHAGKSVEISNTDAEGRLVLADALSYLQKKYPVSRIIDLATLTGAIVVTLGEEVSGLFCNHDRLAKQLMEAGERTFERLWRLPLYPEYQDALKSPIADMKNSGGRKGGSITAALFLKSFIQNDLPWAHLDIAGTALLSELKRPYHPSHATGVGVRLLIDFFSSEI